MQSVVFFEKVSKVSLYLLAFLLPLWFLPLTQDILNFQKQALLVVLLFLGVVAWLAKTLNRGEFQFRKSLLHWPVLAVVVATFLATMFSLWRYGSFWGWPLDLSDNFLTIFLFAVLYFFITQSVADTASLFRVLTITVFSAVAAGVFAVLQLYQIFLLPFDFSKVSSFNTVGSANSVAVLAAVILPLCLILAFASKLLLRWILWGAAALLMAVLLLINFYTAWLVLAAGLLVLLAFGMWNLKKRTEFGWVSFPMALLIVALFFAVFKVSVPGAPNVPLEVSPSRTGEIEMIQQVMKDHALFGSGPGTFVFDYAKYHSPELNKTIFWGTRFSSGASEILDWVVTKGIVGGLALAVLILSALFLGLKALVKGSSDALSWIVGLGSFASLTGAAVAMMLYSSTFILWFVFWILLGAVAISLQNTPRKVSVVPPSFLAVVSSFAFLLILIFGLGLLFVGGQKYIAEVRYLEGARAAGQGNLDGAISGVLSAARLNPVVDLYWRDLAQLYLNQMNQIGANRDLSEEERNKQIQSAVSNAVTSARQAASASPANIANWNVQGFVARNLVGIQGADALFVQSYEKAIELDPSSPFSWTELGRAYILQAQSLASQKGVEEKRAEVLALALERLQKAVELKADYAPAHYLIAVVFEQQGKSDEAVAKLEETKIVAPNDLGLAFQLGVVYWQRQEFNKAKTELERALSIDSNYSNARYLLGLVLDKQGNREKSIAEFERVATANPDNTEIQKIISNLKAGRPALEGVTPAQPPISENPSEIKK